MRPLLNQAADAQVRYEIHDGVFKRIALRAAAEGLRVDNAPPEFDELWELLVRQLAAEGTRVVKSQSGKTYQLSVSAQGSIWSSPCEVDPENNVLSVGDGRQVASKDNAALYWTFRADLGPEPDKLTYEKTTALFAREKGGSGGNSYTALWIVYKQLWELSRSVGARKAGLADRTARVQPALDKPEPTTTFSFSAKTPPAQADKLAALAARPTTTFLFSAKTPQFVLIIDEINRGNISKILGELITLLEPDKRLTARSELKLPLSYTPQHRFAVPPNLHVLGTMNTADRSIALMDVALRRRFTFEELMPDAGVIRSALREQVPDQAFIELVADIFETLNDRIRFLYDRDHQLGHSYFLGVTDVDSLRVVFLDRIIPMLQEYFYGVWDKICIVLGCPYNESGEPKRRESHLLKIGAAGKSYAHPIVTAQTFPEVKTLGFDHDDYEDRVDYHVRGEFQQGKLSREDLCRTFLGVLTIDNDKFAQRLAAFQTPVEDAPTSSEAVR
ncbi:MAG: AAA family ATPase [Myxococcales bacterium]|nr:AAA family ATPase [Myxococcales bacterium]